ncbi:MAG: hypothetical protein FWG79_00680 [Bacteroidales bacterium]|nr:hypothetical protein [Bacteroidales bacterium]
MNKKRIKKYERFIRGTDCKSAPAGGFYKSPEDFRRYGNNGVGWDFRENPLDIYGTKSRQYVDYQDPTQRNLLNVLSIKTKWYDHASWLLLPAGGPIWVGLINSRRYNR